jgi:hypothetical protein
MTKMKAKHSLTSKSEYQHILQLFRNSLFQTKFLRPPVCEKKGCHGALLAIRNSAKSFFIHLFDIDDLLFIQQKQQENSWLSI